MELHNVSNDGLPEGGVYIGRGTPLGNPYVMGKDGCRLTVVARYRIWLYRKLLERDPEVEQAFRALKSDSHIGCHCAPELCHGHVVEYYHSVISEAESYEAGLAILAKSKVPFIGLDPKEDGFSHINAYSRSEVELGRMLSNMYRAIMSVPGHGTFESVEGFWYYIKTGMKHEELRTLSGYEAKKRGQSFERVEMPPETFHSEIRKAIYFKICQNQDILKAYMDSSKPILHYYYYGDLKNPKVVTVDGIDWMVNYLNTLRDELRRSAMSASDISQGANNGKTLLEIIILPEDVPF